MKKIIFAVVVLLMAAPAFATVDITCAPGPGPNDVTISFSNDDAGMNVRAIALDISLDTPDACVCEANCVSEGYDIYPGSIEISAEGVVTNYGSCLCDSSFPGTNDGLESNNVTIEMGSLYADPDPAPDQENVELVILTLCGCADVPVNVNIELNAIRGGVVMEDPDATPVVNLSGCAASLPSCAACPTCLGDLNGDQYKTTTDLGMLFNALGMAGYPYQISSLDPGWNPCGDLNGDNFMTTTDLGMLFNELGIAGNPWQIPCP